MSTTNNNLTIKSENIQAMYCSFPTPLTQKIELKYGVFILFKRFPCFDLISLLLAVFVKIQERAFCEKSCIVVFIEYILS